MPKNLLITALVSMQLLSWSGRSLYLCLCGSSACVDFGPASCHCRQPDHDGSHRDCDHERQSNALAVQEKADCLQRTGDSCECTHFQISAATMPRLVGEISPERSKPYALAFADASLNTISSGIPSGQSPGTSSPWLSHDTTFLRALSTIVLRC